MKKEQGPLMYIGQPALKPLHPIMQHVVKADEEVSINEIPLEEGEQKQSAESGRLKPFREMNVEEKVIYLAERRIPVPCQFEWKNGSVRGIIERFDQGSVWVLDETGEKTVRVPIEEIVYIRIAGT
ncbi:hypothetical protein BTO30_02610 [Domibacillus antri]|uniref:Spore coat protein CotO n=1 Tax=Domibacillus antri TaxID=1714264 RepID=A0A1Q8Q967_9BACI|nr:CotO family spore coat protein [Domibacillus antri]OLN23851.1 hypothetical protein BTO30_02610 [Domibacillus antri]